jgi:shikimate dehydrogenase
MNSPPTVYVLESGKHQNISDSSKKSSYKIRHTVSGSPLTLPSEIEKRVQNLWKSSDKKSQYADSPLTCFLHSFDENTSTDIVHEAPFKYAYCFGKSSLFKECSFFADNLGLIALSSICLIRTADKKLAFGIKKNMSSKISGFSGYIHHDDFDKGQVKILSYLIRTLSAELNITKNHITDVIRTGQVYSPDILDEKNKTNNKAFNNTFVANLNISSGALDERFKESEQFEKGLIFIDDEVSSIIQFVLANHRDMSIHCIGAIYTYLSSFYSDYAANQLIDTIGTESIQVRLSLKSHNITVQQVIRDITPYVWGLIGNAQIAEYSVAPQMWNSLFELRNMPIKCVTFGSDNRQEVLNYLENEKHNPYFLGCNIARPWKGTSFLVCDTSEPGAEAVETVNTIVKKNRKFLGYNTDGRGIVKSISRYVEISGKQVLLLGAGGASKTVPRYLLNEGVKAITVVDSNREKTNALVRTYAEVFAKAQKALYGVLREDLPNSFPKADIIINSTPAGSIESAEQAPFDLTLLKNITKDCVIAEMVYNPYHTPLLEEALKIGCKVSPGINMLVDQAAESFALAFGSELSKDEKHLLVETTKLTLHNESR